MKARLVSESLNFERGKKDPKISMGIGRTARRDFNNFEEIIEWLYNYPEVYTDGKVKKWEKSDAEYSYTSKLWSTSSKTISKLELVRWIKWNIKLDGELLGLRDAKEIADQLSELIGNPENYSFQSKGNL